jgi:hypothetical protein
MRRFFFTALLSASALVLAGCEDSTVAPTDPTAEAIAAEIGRMQRIDLIHVFDGGTLVYIFTTGTRADAIRITRAELDGTVLVVTPADQGGAYYFALDEAKAAGVDDNSLILRF